MIYAKTQLCQTPYIKWGRSDGFLSIFVCVSLSEDPVPKDVLWADEGSEKLSSLDYLSDQIQTKGSQKVDLLRAFIKTDGSQIDIETRPSGDFDLKADLLHGRVKVLTQTDRPEWHCEEAKNTRRISTIPHRRI